MESLFKTRIAPTKQVVKFVDGLLKLGYESTGTVEDVKDGISVQLFDYPCTGWEGYSKDKPIFWAMHKDSGNWIIRFHTGYFSEPSDGNSKPENN